MWPINYYEHMRDILRLQSYTQHALFDQLRPAFLSLAVSEFSPKLVFLFCEPWQCSGISPALSLHLDPPNA